MAHHEHTLLQVRQVFLQPLHRIQVKVVGRLVQQQVVGVAEQGFGQHHAHLLVVRYVGHLLVVLTLLHAKVLQQLRSFALSLVAVHLGKGHLQLGSAVAVFLGHFGLVVESFALFHVVPHGLMAHQHGVHHRIFVVFEVVLLQHGHALAGKHLDGSLVGFQLAADGAE